MQISTPRHPLRPLALAVGLMAIVASSVLVSAASLGSPTVSGYGIDRAQEAPPPYGVGQ
jgi:hypothetical protein